MPKGKQKQEDIEEKPKKPKAISKVTLTVHDNGQLTADFDIWEENEVGKRKKWTVGGEECIKYLFHSHPEAIKQLANLINAQIATSGLPVNFQARPVVVEDGKLVYANMAALTHNAGNSESAGALDALAAVDTSKVQG